MISQCFKSEILNRIPPGYFDNFLLKVNGKIGGQNSALDPEALRTLPFDTSRTMMVGIDVNHPGEAERVLSSVAAAVGSYDPAFSCYNAAIRVQRKERDEMLRQLDSMVGLYYKVSIQYYYYCIFLDGRTAEGIPQQEQMLSKECDCFP